MADTLLDEKIFLEATQRGDAERAAMPMPVAARYDPPSGRIVVDFANGASFMVPARSLQGLEQASDDELAQLSLAGETGLSWQNLDVDFTIAGLMRGVFGTASFMEAARRGGKSRSDAKIAASRANDARGGRPRKTSSGV